MSGLGYESDDAARVAVKLHYNVSNTFIIFLGGFDKMNIFYVSLTCFAGPWSVS